MSKVLHPPHRRGKPVQVMVICSEDDKIDSEEERYCMTIPTKKPAIFKGRKIRRHWDDEKELWYFSIVDVIHILTNSPNPRSYWKVLKFRLKDEGSEVVTKCNQLKMQASDGKMYFKSNLYTSPNFKHMHVFRGDW